MKRLRCISCGLYRWSSWSWGACCVPLAMCKNSRWTSMLSQSDYHRPRYLYDGNRHDDLVHPCSSMLVICTIYDLSSESAVIGMHFSFRLTSGSAPADRFRYLMYDSPSTFVLPHFRHTAVSVALINQYVHWPYWHVELQLSRRLIFRQEIMCMPPGR
jgi:hypothetical protein